MLNPWRIDPYSESESEGDEAEARLSELKRDIALARYEVDASTVAGEILAKLRLVRRGRAAISVFEAGRSRMPPPGRLPVP